MTEIYLQKHGAKSLSYYHIRQDGSQIHINSGSPSKPKIQTKSFPDTQKANNEYHKLVWKKLGEGFFAQNRHIEHSLSLLLEMRAPNKDNSENLDLHPLGHSLLSATLTPDRQTLQLHEIEIASGRSTLLFQENYNKSVFIHQAYYLPCGNQIYYQIDCSTYLWRRNQNQAKCLATYQEFRSGPNPHQTCHHLNKLKNRHLYFAPNQIRLADENQNIIWQLPFDWSQDIEYAQACVSPSGRLVAFFIRQDQQGQIKIYDTSSGTCQTLPAGPMKISRLRFSPDERELGFTQGYAEGVGFYDLATGQLARHMLDAYRTDRWHTCFDFDFSADSRYLAAHHAIYLYKQEQLGGPQFHLFEGNRRSYKYIFSPDGRLCIQGGDSGKIMVYTMPD